MLVDGGTGTEPAQLLVKFDGLFGEGATHFETHDALAGVLRNELREGVRVLVKGSRGIRTEVVVDRLKAEYA